MKTPMSSDTKLIKDEECELVDSTKYRGMIFSLLYLMASRPDIMFSVCLYARFQEDPKTSLLEAVKRIFRYNKVTTHLGLWYPKGTDIETLVFSDSDHAGDYVDRKSTSESGQILKIPFRGQCSFTDKWSLDDLQYSVPTSEPYQTDPHFPDEIKNYGQEEREGPITRIHHDVVVDVEENQILTREIVSIMKSWVEIIHENVFCLSGNWDHVFVCLCHMLYCIATSTDYNLAYFIAKRIEFVTKQPRLILPYGMLLTRLFKYVMSESPELSNDRYVLYDRVMYPLTAQKERKTRKDYGTRRGRSSMFSSSAFGQPSSCHLNDDDNDGNDKGTSRASTPSPTRFVNH
ncbi:hypothetical protein Tco_1219183 [Tanacetum coccineum]